MAEGSTGLFSLKSVAPETRSVINKWLSSEEYVARRSEPKKV